MSRPVSQWSDQVEANALGAMNVPIAVSEFWHLLRISHSRWALRCLNSRYRLTFATAP